MFAALAPDELLGLIEAHDRRTAELVQALAAFDGDEGWDADAATSMHAWLRDRARMSGREAARLVSLARRLRNLPVTAEAWADGDLSGGQVEVVASTVGRRHDRFDEDAIVPALAPLSVLDTVTAMQRWRQRLDAEDEADDPVDVPVPSRVHLSECLDGRGALDGDLDADDHEVVKTALRLAETKDLPAEPLRTASERRADALVDVCRWFLDHQQDRAGGRHRPHVNLLVDVDRMTGHYVGGAECTREVLERYFCDSAFHRLLTAGRSTVLDLGVATRVLTAALWTALVARDEHCRFPGCDRPASWCDGHHVVWFSHGGPTSIDNLVLLCRRHHRRLHRPGWYAKLLPDGTFEVTDPSGTTRTSRPPGALEPFW